MSGKVRERQRDRVGETVKVAASLPCTEAAELMNQISLGLMHGTLTVRSGDRHGVFRVGMGSVIQVEIRAAEEGDEGAMQIALRWRLPLSVTTTS